MYDSKFKFGDKVSCKKYGIENAEVVGINFYNKNKGDGADGVDYDIVFLDQGEWCRDTVSEEHFD